MVVPRSAALMAAAKARVCDHRKLDPYDQHEDGMGAGH